MKTKTIVGLVGLLSLLGSATVAITQGTAFTYQGQLTDGGQPANGIYDLRFAIYANASGGSPVAGPITNSLVGVTNGLFTVALDFGAGVFTGAERWLEIAVRATGAGAFTNLSPRQPITPTPYALHAGSAASLPNGTVTSAMLADGAVTAGKLAPGAVSQLGAPDGSPLNALQVNTNGLVGIGTSAPAAGLHIAAGQPFLHPVPLSVQVDQAGGYTNLYNAVALAVEGSLVAVASEFGGVTLMDISNASSPILLSQFRDGDGAFTNLAGAFGMALKPGLLAIAAAYDDAVTLVDVSDPNNPIKRAELRDGVGGFNELSGARSVAVSGNLLAIAAAKDSAVTLVNIANPAAPVRLAELKDEVSGFTNLSAAAGVALSGNLLAIAAGFDHAVTLVDVSNPANPIKRAELRDGVGGYTGLRGAWSLDFSGPLLAIAAPDDPAVTLVDVSNPAAPVKLGEWRDGVNADFLGTPYSVAFSGTGLLAVTAHTDHALTVFDVSNPAAARIVAVARLGVGGFNHLNGAGAAKFAPGGRLVAAAYGSHAVTVLELATAQAGLSSAGWVGIGTTQPAAPLHVVGNLVVQGAERVELDATLTEWGVATTASGVGSTAMGHYTTASGDYATAMGSATIASGVGSTAMGAITEAAGAGSLAAGYRAKARHPGTFVWADWTEADFASSAANQFNVRATGGVRVDTGAGPGISLSAADTPLITRGWDAFGPTAPASKQGHGRWGLFMENFRLALGIPDNVGGRYFEVAKYSTNGTSTPLMTVNQAGTVTAAGFSGNGAGLTGIIPADNSVTTAKIADGTIVNADIAPTAAIADTKLATIASPGKVANAATTGTRTNTPNTLVLRDAAGDFAAGTITATAFVGGGAGLTSLNASQLTSGTVPDARLGAGVARTQQVWLVGGNSGTTPGTHFLGTSDNQPVEFKVNGQRALRLEPHTNSPNVLGGSPFNVITNGNYGAVIAGGGSSDKPNRVGGNYATVGGGAWNTASGDLATVSGGWYSTSSADLATVGGGAWNTASGTAATVAGGSANTASGAWATVSGGYKNTASGDYSLAAGRHAKANHAGAFVWADSADTDFASTRSNQFNLRATGGVRVDTGSGPGISLSAADTPLITRGWDAFGPTAPAAKQGHGRWGLFMEAFRLALGIPDDVGGRYFEVAKYSTNGTSTPLMTVNQGGTVTATAFNPTSDRAAKENFAPVDCGEVLEKVVALPLARWNFKQEPGVAHLGPVAQDFHAAFGLGADDKHIATVDADGVALAAIQGLNEKAEVRSAKSEAGIRELKAENAALRAELEQLKQLVGALAAQLNGGAQ
jgi:hypothetical protein